MQKTNTLQSLDTLKVLGDPRRVEILQLLMAEPATLSQLGRVMNMHAAKVRHHLKKLEDVGLVAFVSSREVRGFVEKYYQATSQAYFVNYAILPQPGEHGTIFSIGSHDLALELLANHLAQDSATPNLIALAVGSLDGLIALRQGYCQLTGCHLFDPLGGEYNTSYVRHLFPGQPMHVVTLAHREQGLLVAPGNPHQIHSLEDLGREDLTFINRKKGSGTRLWLDQQLKTRSMQTADIQGYNQEVSTHSQVAEAVLQGAADFGLGVLAAAKRYNLDFIPLFEERFDLVIPDENYRSALLLPALEYLNTAEFRLSVQKLGGYDPQETGKETQLP
jgi:molybdate-binding protein/DNA-binding HxlR family transcriptional regulator